MFGKCFHYCGNVRSLLSYCNIDADYTCSLLINYRVKRDSGLSCLPVSNDKLSLSPADRNHAVNCLNPCLYRLFHRLSLNDVRRLSFNGAELICNNRALIIYRPAECINDPSDHCISNRYPGYIPCPFDGIAFLDHGVFAEEDCTYVVFFKVKDHPHYIAREFEQFPGHCIFKSINSCNAVTNLEHGPDTLHMELSLESL